MRAQLVLFLFDCGASGVYVSKTFEPALAQLSSTEALESERNFSKDCFTFAEAPIWLDSSTATECALIERELGGPRAVAERSGSRAYERFTGAQVLKRARAPSGGLRGTHRVLLLSSFLASVLCGRIAPVDVGDASGTNMMDIAAGRWWPEAVVACRASGLMGEEPVQGWSVLGCVSSYFVRRFGVRPDAVCTAWSGDNPNTIAGYGGLEEGDFLVSLGTSDTAQWVSSSGQGAPFGHTFRSPLSCEEQPKYFRMLCYANGSRTREAVRDGEFFVKAATAADARGRNWKEFDEAVASVEPGCLPHLKVATSYLVPEIVPRVARKDHVDVLSVSNVLSSGAGKTAATSASWAETCRLVAEMRALTIAVHGHAMDGESFKPRRVLMAGGGSSSKALQQIMADVLDAPVFAHAGVSSAAIGAARRALHSVCIRKRGEFIPFEQCAQLESTQSEAVSSGPLALPRAAAVTTYNVLKEAHRAISDPY